MGAKTGFKLPDLPLQVLWALALACHIDWQAAQETKPFGSGRSLNPCSQKAATMQNREIQSEYKQVMFQMNNTLHPGSNMQQQ